MGCARCDGDGDVDKRRWCRACEQAYDTWVRRHATDIIWPVLAGMTVVTTVAMVLPMLGAGSLIATGGVFAGFGTLLGMYRVNQRRRRHQFLTASLPRAYLTTKS